MMRRDVRWRWLAGGTASLVFSLLLGVRLGVIHRPASAEPAATERLGLLQDSDTWMNITQQGRKIGYTNRSLATTENGFRYSEQIRMQINTMGIVQPITVRTVADLKTDRTLESFQFELGSNLFRFTARGEVAEGKLTLRSGVAGQGQETVSVLPLVAKPYLSGGILESLGGQGLREGETKTVPVFDPATLAQRPVRITALGEEAITIGGQLRRARKLAVDFLGVKQTAWVDAQGAVLREEGILGIVLEKVSRNEALGGIDAAAGTDLTEVAAIPSPMPIAAPDKLTLLKIRLKGVETAPFLLTGGRQHYDRGVLTLRRESTSALPGRRSPATETPSSASLAATPLIQADHPRIVQKAAEIVAAADSPGEKARKLVQWVYDHLQKRPVLSVPNALETLENGVGDCNEHAVLVAALARAAGVPAEVEAGLVYLRGRFYYHAWNLLYVPEWGGWITADAVLGQFPADVTHIRFVRGGADLQVDLLGLIGKLNLEILEMR